MNEWTSKQCDYLVSTLLSALFTLLYLVFRSEVSSSHFVSEGTKTNTLNNLLKITQLSEVGPPPSRWSYYWAFLCQLVWLGFQSFQIEEPDTPITL